MIQTSLSEELSRFKKLQRWIRASHLLRYNSNIENEAEANKSKKVYIKNYINTKFFSADLEFEEITIR